MTRDEFNDWKSDLCIRMPAIDEWMGGLPYLADTLQAWYDAMQSLDASDCLELSKRLVSGRTELLRGYSEVPAFWLLHAPGLASAMEDFERAKAEREEAVAKFVAGRNQPPPTGGMRAAAERFEQIRKEEQAGGLSEEDARFVATSSRREEWESLL